MSERRDPISEADLHAYADSILPEGRRAEVEAFLAEHPEEADKVRAYQRQNQALRALLDPVLEEPIPYRLMLEGRWRRFPALQSGALLACFVLGIAVGWWLWGREADRRNEAMAFVRRAAIAHLVYAPEVRHPVEVSADQEEHLVQWLSKRLGAPLRAPHLSNLGYQLVGGRLLPGGEGPVAQFMYQDERGKRLTLYLRPGSEPHQDATFRFVQEGTVKVLYWFGDKLSCAVSGDVDKAELMKVADAIYQELNPYIYD
jgi:anti-sigma factor RsiW